MLNIVQKIDTTLFFFVNSHHAPSLDWFFLIVTQFGNAWIVVPILVGAIVYITPRSDVKRVLLCSVIAISVSSAINTQIKVLVHRPRPIAYFEQHNRGAEQTKKESLATNNDMAHSTPTVRIVGPTLRRNSFPSGHSNTAFSAAMLLFLLYGGTFWLSFALAVLVAYSRVYLGVHFPFDTIAGALIALISVWIVLYICKRIRLFPRRENE